MAKENHTNKEGALEMKKSDQYRTVEELIQKSKPDPVYFTLLIASSFVIASGLLLENSSIVIGGMLLTPVLSPMLVIALGIATGQLRAVKNTALLALKSFVIVIASALLLGFLMGISQEPEIFENSMRTSVLYFIVSLSAGVAATFIWARREISEVLPGAAIAVSLVPPLSLVGIGLSLLNFEIIRFYFSVFFFNVFGVLLGSLVVFSLLKFHRTEEKFKKEEAKADSAKV